jgi:hypothetical protein
MKKTLIQLALILFVNLYCGSTLLAADADFMRSTGKIYVVVGVILLLFLGIVFYLILLDRRLTKFENQMKSDE